MKPALREIVHKSANTYDKWTFSNRVVECSSFKDAGLKQGGYGVVEEDFYVHRIPKKGFHIFVFTLSGMGKVTMDDDTELILKPGDCFISWANGQGHLEKTIEGSRWEMIWFSIWGNHTFFYPSSSDYDVLPFSNGARLKEIVRAIKNEDYETDKDVEAATNALENLFLINVKRSLGWINQGPGTRGRAILNDLWSAVYKELNRAWTIEELCEKSGLSKTHLNRLCQENYGESPAQKVKNIKMQEAKLLLRNSDETISEIAYSTGFSSLAIFSHFFKDYFGMSPKEFRKQETSGPH